MNTYQEILTQVEEYSKTTDSWIELSNFIFSNQQGIVSKYFPTKAERAEFINSPHYKRIQQLLFQKIKYR